MSDTPGGPGWWMADDGKWYAPDQRVGDGTAVPAGPTAAQPEATVEASGSSGPRSTGAGGAGRRRVGLVAAMTAVGVLAGAVAAFVLLGDDENDGEAFGSPDDGEVFLEPADEVGDDAFTDVAFVTTPAVGIDVEVPDGGVEAIGSSRGSTPGLFGGTQDDAWCDVDAMVEFLNRNPDHAAAFVDALAADPTWRSEEDPDLGSDRLAAYLETLTPVLLTADTRVTNHGYRDGAPLPFQAVLQAGTAVLVDVDGVPRVRCACGNPLTAPAAVRGSVAYTGTRWAAFDTTRLIVVQAAPQPVDVFVLVDVVTGDRFERPAGSTGSADRPVRGQTPLPTTTVPSATTSDPPATTTPSPPAHEDPEPVARLVGTWTGTYVCAQGETALELIIEPAGGREVTAVFAFSAATTNPTVPTGSFNMAGAVDGDRYELHPVSWIDQPPGWQMLSMVGPLPGPEGALRGSIPADDCGSYVLNRAG